MAKILLINPCLRIDNDFIDYPYFVNQGLYLIRELLINLGHDAMLFDSFCNPLVRKTEESYILGSNDGLFENIKKFKPDFSIILNSPFLKLFNKKENDEILNLIACLKQNNSKVILADCFTTGMHYYDYDAEEIRKNYGFDAVCKHESEQALLNAIDPLIKSLKSCSKPRFAENLDDLPLPAFSEKELDNYNQFLLECEKNGLTDLLNFEKKTLPLITSRGCMYNCIFCSSRIYDRKYRQHSIEYLDKQLEYAVNQHEIQKVVFLDDLLNPSKERLIQILDLLEKYGLACEIPNGLRADNLDENILARLKEFTDWIKISAESGIQKTMDKIGKGLDLDSVTRTAKICKELKLPLLVHFMIGFPFETIKDMNKTLKFALELHEKYEAKPLLQFAAPIKGSKLYDMYEDAPENYMGYLNGELQKNKESLKKLKTSFKLRMDKDKLEKIIINVTYECNNNCVYCAIGDRRSLSGDYKYQRDSMIKARKKGVSCIDFDGGEPTLSPNLIRLIHYAKKLGYSQINLTTNGRILSDMRNAKKICNSGITSILFSLHGPNAEIHERITRTKGSFIEAVQGINNVLKLKNKKLDVGINITLADKNIQYLEDFVEFIRLLGIKKLNIQMLTPFGVARKNLLPDENILRKKINEVMLKHDKDFKINLINFISCFFEDNKKLEEELISDFGKNQRNMLFIDREEQNLADFLSKKRFKTEKCKFCAYDIICKGFWDFGKNEKKE